MVEPESMLIVTPVDWIVIAVPPAAPDELPPVPWTAPEWSMISVPAIEAGTVRWPKVTPEFIVNRFGTATFQ